MSYLITEIGPAQPSLGYVGSTVWVDTFNPVRVKATRSQDTSGKSWFRGSPADDPFASSTDYPVRYTNRQGTDQRAFALDGDYYLRVNADRNEKEPSSTAFLITVVVSGDLEPGPTYLTAGTAATSTGGTVTSDPSSSAATPTTTSPISSSDPGRSVAGTTAQGGPAADNSVPGWLWALGGALVAGAGALVVALLSRRRRAHHAAADAGAGPGERR